MNTIDHNNSIINVSTEYSLDKSVINTDALLDRAKETGAGAVIVTEKNTLRSAPKILTRCNEEGIRASVGIRTALFFDGTKGEIALIPKDYCGMMILGKLLYEASDKAVGKEPYVTLKNLEVFFGENTEAHDRIILTTCGADGIVYKMLCEGKEDTAGLLFKRLSIIFGKDNVFAEVRFHGEPQERTVFPRIADIADSKNIALLATNDSYYVYDSDDDRTKYDLMAFRRSKQYNGLTESDRHRYIKTGDEIKTALSAVLTDSQTERATEGISALSLKCDVRLRGETHYPKYKCKDNKSSEDLLSRIAFDSIPMRFDEWSEEHENRLIFELSVIQTLGFCDYMLIVSDIVKFAKSEAIRLCKYDSLPVGPGRGSAAGSLVCYLLGITDIDPMEHNLMFDRFLNLSRKSMPDIDIDVAPFVRDRVVSHITEKYGRNAVCGIIETTRFKAKESVITAAKYLSEKTGDRSFTAVGEKISGACKAGTSLDENEQALAAFSDDAKAGEILKTAFLIDGSISALSKHPCGIVISDSDDISDYIPVIPDKSGSGLLADCDKGSAEKTYGLLKIDVLSLSTLDMISNIIASVEKHEGERIRFSAIPPEDKVFENVFHDGNTDYIFQFGSRGMKEWLRKIHPQNINELMLLVAGYRPGPMQFLPEIKAVLFNEKAPDYISPLLKPILADTCGCIVFQEQLIEIFRSVAGFHPAEADVIRSAVCKKNKVIINSVREKFLDGCISKGLSQEQAKSLFERIVQFGSYAFNKSHAAAYAVLAYRMAWLFYHYPSYFLAAGFKYSDHKNDVSTFYKECCRCGVTVHSPDINRSGIDACADPSGIIIGFSMIDGCTSIGKRIAEDRKRRCSGYADMADFVVRIKPDETELKNLALCGAFESIKAQRGAVVKNCSEILKQADDITEYLSRYSSESDEDIKSSILEKINECRKNINSLSALAENMSVAMMIRAEQSLMGIPVSFERLYEYDSCGKERRTTTIKNITEGHHRVCGMVMFCKDMKRKKDKAPFLKVDLSDESGYLSCVLSPYYFSKYEKLISEGEYLCFEGDYSIKGGEAVFWISAVSKLEETNISYYLRFENYTDWIEAQEEIMRNTDYSLANLYVSVCGGEWTLFQSKVSPEIVKSFPMIEIGESR